MPVKNVGRTILLKLKKNHPNSNFLKFIVFKECYNMNQQ